MKTCTRCISPETWDTIEFGPDGGCNICKGHDVKRSVDWDARKKQLLDICAKAKARGDQYDCIVPASGAKDSAFTLWYVVKELGLKPLVVRFDHGLYRPQVNENFKRMTKILGVDVTTFEVSFHVVREVMVLGLLRRGDSCTHCHAGVYANTMQQVLRHRIPLVIWGEPIGEYQHFDYGYGDDDELEQVDEKRFNRVAINGMTAEDMLGMFDGRLTARDLAPFSYPPASELKRLGLQSICLGNYFPWNVREQYAIIQKELGWKGDYVENVPPGFEYEKIECQMEGVRSWIRWVKRGHSRVTHLANIEIRHGRMTRDEALELEKNYIPKRPASLDHFLKMWEMTEDEFMEIVQRHTIPPHHHVSGANDMTAAPSDLPQWDDTQVPWPNRPSTKPLARA